MKNLLKIGVVGLVIAGVVFGVTATKVHNKGTNVADGSPPNVNVTYPLPTVPTA